MRGAPARSLGEGSCALRPRADEDSPDGKATATPLVEADTPCPRGNLPTRAHSRCLHNSRQREGRGVAARAAAGSPWRWKRPPPDDQRPRPGLWGPLLRGGSRRWERVRCQVSSAFARMCIYNALSMESSGLPQRYASVLACACAFPKAARPSGSKATSSPRPAAFLVTTPPHPHPPACGGNIRRLFFLVVLRRGRY